MKIRITFLTIALLLGTVLSYGQNTWQVGSPNAADVTATLVNGTLRISGTGEMKNFFTDIDHPNIPSFPLGMSSTIKKIIVQDGITRIGTLSFQNDYALEEASIAGSVVTIGNQAFLGCRALKSIYLPKTVETIESSAFNSCGFESIMLSSGEIGSYAFSGCASLQTVVIKAGVSEIENNAFSGCSALTSVTVEWPTPLSINENVFNGVNRSNATLYVPAGKKALYEAAAVWKDFGTIVEAAPTWLIGYPNAADVTATLDSNGTLTISGTGKIQDYDFYSDGYTSPLSSNRDIKKVVIENGVTHIGELALTHSFNLEEVSIPNSVTSIGEGAFSECYSLKTLNIPNAIETIGLNAFTNNKVESITIASGKIGSWAFSSSRLLQTVVIKSGVSEISNNAFSGCVALNSVTVEWPTPLSISEDVFNGVNLSYVTLTVPAGTKSLYQAANVWKDFETIIEDGETWQIGSPNAADVTATLSNGTLTITGTGAIRDGFPSWPAANVTSVSIGSGITRIGDCNFQGCKNMQEIIIPNTVTSIGNQAFYYCSALKSIDIPESVTSIGTNAFYGAGLESVTIPAGTVGESAFLSCESLQTVTIKAAVTSIGSQAFRGCDNLKTIIIEDGVNALTLDSYIINNSNTFTSWALEDLYIGRNLSFSYSNASPFSGDDKLKNVTIGDNVTALGFGLFGSCTALQEITIPGSVTSIGQSAFNYCTSLTSVTVEWPTPLSINANVFNATDLSGATLIVPEGTKALYQAADVWKNFGNIIEDGETWQIGFPNAADVTATLSNGTLTISGTGKMSSFSGGSGDGSAPWSSVKGEITKVSINGGVTTIGDYAFQGCENLTEVNIPNTVVAIGGRAFATCSALKSINLPSAVAVIGNLAFASSGLEMVTIPASVTEIGERAFANCTSLTRVTVEWATPLAIPDNTFDSVDVSNCFLAVPWGKGDLYAAAPVWKDFKIVEYGEEVWAEGDLVAKETTPSVTGETGSFTLSLMLPTSSTATIAGSFAVSLPEGFSLDFDNTKLSDALVNKCDTTIAPDADKWIFTITEKPTRAPRLRADISAVDIIHVAYKVADDVANGDKTIQLSDLDFIVKENEVETPVRMDNLEVNVEINRTYSTTYTVTVAQVTNGTVTATPTTAAEGEEVTVTITPASGYTTSNISAYKTGDATTSVALSGSGNTRTFKMPAYDVTVTATFSTIYIPTPDPTPDPDPTPTPVTDADWIALQQAISIISSERIEIPQSSAGTKADAEAWLTNYVKDLLKANSFGNISINYLSVFTFNEATAGSSTYANGTNGSLIFDLILANKYTQRLNNKTAIILASVYDPTSNEAAIAGISVSPVPARDFVFIHSDLPIKRIELYSLTGSLIFSGSAADRISVASLPSGIYLLRIYTENGATIRKIVKE